MYKALNTLHTIDKTTKTKIFIGLSVISEIFGMFRVYPVALGCKIAIDCVKETLKISLI